MRKHRIIATNIFFFFFSIYAVTFLILLFFVLVYLSLFFAGLGFASLVGAIITSGLCSGDKTIEEIYGEDE